MITEFSLCPEEIERAKAFEKKHRACARKHPTTIGGHISYMFTPTSIGTAVTVECGLCGEFENITEYNNW